MPGEGAETVLIRRARPEESTTIANLYLTVRLDNLPSIPPVAHADDDVRRWFADLLSRTDGVWVAVVEGVPVAFVVFRAPDWVDQLYVATSHASRGIGSRLLDVAQAQLGGRLQLWTFQANAGARRFYERHGFVAVEETAGDNEEHAPDVRYVRLP